MPIQQSKFVAATSKHKYRQRRIVAITGAVALAAVTAIGLSRLLLGSNQLDPTNGVGLLPADTLLSVAISTDAERWQQLTEFGVPESRAVFQQQLAKFQTNFLTDYGYDYRRDFQPWIGKQILFGYLDSSPSTAKTGGVKIPQLQSIAILPIADRSAAETAFKQHQLPSDTNLVKSSYKGVAIREIRRARGTIAIAILDNFVVIASDGTSLHRVIDTQQGGKSLLAVPGYTKALTEIAIDRPFAQVYVNIPVATAIAAANSLQPLAAAKLAQTQSQQGIAANATIADDGIAWQGISWLKPNTTQKLVVENQAQNLATNLPADTLVMVSGGNLQRLWQDYVLSADGNPLAPFQPNDVVKNLNNLTGLDLNSEILNWSKGAFNIAIVPKSARVDTDFGAGLVWLQQVNDRSAADKAFVTLDRTIAQQLNLTIVKDKLNDKDITKWSSPLGVTAATHGWLDGNLAFLNLGAPVASSIVSPTQKLSDNLAFQQSTRSNLNPNNDRFFIDVDRTVNAGNITLPLMSPEVTAMFKAVKTLGVTSAITDESTNRFDIFVALKKVAGVAKIPTKSKPQSSTSPLSQATTSPSQSPNTIRS